MKIQPSQPQIPAPVQKPQAKGSNSVDADGDHDGGRAEAVEHVAPAPSGGKGSIINTLA